MSQLDPKLLANAVRFLAIDACEQAGEGHPGTPLGAADACTALFTRHLKFNPADPLWFDRDRFVLSAGHGSMLLYALLHLSGYEALSLDQLRRFRQLGSHTEGHPERHPERGIEVTTGLLGQGIANAAGMAVAEVVLRTLLGADLVDHWTYAQVGDGCLQEGIGQEVISLAGHLRLGKLVFLWDDNRMTDDGPIDIALSDDIPSRFRLSHWHVQEVDGHDIDAVSDALAAAKRDSRPSLIACRTTIGRGIPGVEGSRAAHSARVMPAHSQAARDALDWPHPPFETPENIRQAWTDATRRSTTEYDGWQARVAALPPERRALLDRLRDGRLPDDWRACLHDFKRVALDNPAPEFGIMLSAAIVDRLTDIIPELVAGAPDLEAPTQHKRRLPAFTAGDQTGRYLHYGIREHAMGGMMNGMAAHGGILPIGATYLVFSDYMRPPIRMAAMMGLPVPFVFSHDSIGIGRNGPTHQPVEFLASLRSIPNLLVLRPADAVEAAECWEIALEHRTGPSAMIFARQQLAPVRIGGADENLTRRGAYVLFEPDGECHVTLLATGSEVSLALAARDLLAAENILVAVVSMPSWELFEQQSDHYRNAVLGLAPRVAVEAAVRLGWDRYIGPNGGFVGMSGFGASGSGEELYTHFGITASSIIARVHSLVSK